MKTVIVKTHDTSKTVNEAIIITQDGKPNVIKAGKNVNYEFFDESIGRAPNHVITKRVDKDLHVSFEREGKETDLIIEGFYNNDNQALIGISEDGGYYHYIPDTGEVYDYVTQLEAGAAEGQALGGDEMAAPWWVAAPVGFPWWLGLGLIPLAFIKDKDDDTPTPVKIIPTVSIVATDGQAIEGADNDPLVFTVSQTNVSNVDTTVVVKLGASNNSIEAADIATISYTDASGTVVTLSTQADITNFLTNGATITIKAGQTAAPAITVTVVDDAIYEQSEEMVLEISSPVNATLGTDSATGVVLDNDNTDTEEPNDGDKPTVSIVATDDEAVEGDADDPLVFTVSQDKVSNFDTTVVVKLGASNNSIEAADIATISYTDASGTVVTLSTQADITNFLTNGATITIKAGQTAAPAITVTVVDDAIYEQSEEMVLEISSPVNATLGTDSATGVVLDNDNTDTEEPNDGDKPTVSIVATDDEAVEGDADDPLVFTVSQDKVSNFDTTVVVKLGASNNSIEAADIATISYTDASGTVVTLSTQADITNFLTNGATITIKAGQTAAPAITVTVVDDAIYEQSEEMVLEISSPVNATLGTDSATGVVLDNDNTDTEEPNDGDKPTVSIVATDDEAVEGDADDPLVFTVSQDKVSNFDTTVVVKLGASNNSIEAADIATISYTDASGTVVTLSTQADITNFLTNGATITIKAGQTAAPAITVTVVDDAIYEQSEEMVLEISSPVNATLGTDSATGVVLDNDNTDTEEPNDGDKPTVSIVATDDEAVEGDADDPLVFTVSQDKVSNFDTTVVVKLGASNNSIEAADIATISYTDASGTVVTLSTQADITNFLTNGATITIKAGQTAAPAITVTVVDDAIYEQSEEMVLEISSPVNATLGTDSATGVVLDNDNTDTEEPNDGDKPTVSIVATDDEAVEGDADDPLVFTVSQDKVSNFDTTVVVKLGASNNSIEAADIATISYTDASGTVVTLSTQADITNFLTNGATITIKAGQTAAPAITVTVVDDAIYEQSEEMVLEISSPVNATLGTDSATGVVLDNDSLSMSIKTTVAEATEGTANNTLVFEVSQSLVSSADTSVKVNLAGTGITASDLTSIEYTNATGAVVKLTDPTDIANFLTNGDNVRIEAGSLTAPVITLTVADDSVYEGDETVTATISEAANSIGAPTIAKATDTGVIKDNDSQPTISINDVTVNEADGTTTFTVTLTGETTEAVTVDYATNNGTATSVSDYTATSGTLTFPPGTVSQTITVPITNDNIWEQTEVFSVILSNATNSTIAKGTGIGTIINDDITAIDDTATAKEGGGINNSAGGINPIGNVLSNDDPTQTNATVTEIRIGAIEGSGTSGTVGTALVGTYGTLTLNSDGGYTYIVDNNNATVQALNENSAPLIESFNYTMSDGILSDIAVLKITINGTNDTPVINTINPVRVSEEGLAGGIKDNIGASDTTNAVIASGAILFTDVDNTHAEDFSITLNGPTGINVQGEEVIWTWNAGTNTLTGTVTLDGSSVKVMTIEVGSIKSTGTGFSADYKTTLLHAIDHAPNNPDASVTSIEDELAIDFGVVVNDGSGGSQSAVLSVIVEDDSPTLGLGSISVPVEPVNSNVMITLDISGSMDYLSGVSKPDGGQYTRLQVAKQAINKLLDGYEELGDVRVQLVTFSTSANGNPGNIVNRWMTVSEAKAIVSGLGASGGTNYDAALYAATQAFEETGKLENATNYSYFLTDGDPTYGLTTDANSVRVSGGFFSTFWDTRPGVEDNELGGSVRTGPGNSSDFRDAGIGAGEEAAWIAFLKSQDIKSYAFSMGTGVSDTTNLKPIAYDGTPDGSGNTNDAELAKAITNLNQLDDILLGTLPPSVSKNLIRGDLSPLDAGYGADGGFIYEITIDNKTYRYDEDSNKVFVDNAAVVGNVYNQATFDLTIKTAQGGVLVLDMLTGEYTYQAAASKFYQESIEFTVKDNDGDYVSLNQILDIYLKGEGVNLTGTADSDVLIGRAAAPDILSGGAGNDIIRGKSGNDTLTGGDGNDTFVWLAADKGSLGAPDLDTITDLALGDKIKLSDLLQGETLDDVVGMAKYVNLEGNVLHVSSNGGYTGGTYTAAQTDLNIQLNGFTGTVDDLINNYII